MGHMDEPLIITALPDKRAEIHGRITAYEARIAQAKHDLAHVNATLRLFTDFEKQQARYGSVTASSRRARLRSFAP